MTDDVVYFKPETRYDRFIFKHCESYIFTLLIKAYGVLKFAAPMLVAILSLYFIASIIGTIFNFTEGYREVFSNSIAFPFFAVAILIISAIFYLSKLSKDVINARLETEKRSKYNEPTTQELNEVADRILLAIKDTNKASDGMRELFSYTKSVNRYIDFRSVGDLMMINSRYKEFCAILKDKLKDEDLDIQKTINEGATKFSNYYHLLYVYSNINNHMNYKYHN